MKMTIRNEQASDYRRVETLAQEAFWNLYVPGASEHFIVNQMRKHADFIPELTFVIEVDGEVQGAIFYTHSKIITADDSEYPTITFGPVFISPAYHRQGLGKAMISHSIAAAKTLGYQAIMVLGYPYHYQPYGFVGGKTYRVAMGDGQFYKGLLVLPLVDGALDTVAGIATFSPAFEVAPEAVLAFDQTFPTKVKQHQPSQDEFAA
ncbi:MAG: GNAT family N-acetyltransferase, partial [Culicoidibacterales bacterium]